MPQSGKVTPSLGSYFAKSYTHNDATSLLLFRNAVRLPSRCIRAISIFGFGKAHNRGVLRYLPLPPSSCDGLGFKVTNWVGELPDSVNVSQIGVRVPAGKKQPGGRTWMSCMYEFGRMIRLHSTIDLFLTPSLPPDLLVVLRFPSLFTLDLRNQAFEFLFIRFIPFLLFSQLLACHEVCVLA